MQLHHAPAQPPSAQAVPGNGSASQAMPVPGPARAGVAAPGMADQAYVMAGMLGLWVAISPWFLSLQANGGNATANDLHAGLAAVALAVSAVAGRGLASLQAASALAGVWLIISPFILDAKFPITTAMYWSNVWAGGVIAVLALSALALSRTGATR